MKKLYYEDPYMKEFVAIVTDSRTDERGHYVVLDRTAFYPEGGGQPCDLGSLNGIPVIDVQEIEGEIRHYLGTGTGVPVPSVPGTAVPVPTVQGSIDWSRRFSLMQQHSGEHIVSGLIHRRFGYDNVGFHMGSDLITIDLNGPMDKNDIREIEEEANRYIWENHATNIFICTEEQKESLPYRSKKALTGEVRIVEFPGDDMCACCGLHVRNTGEIGLVKLISVKNFREGVRIEMACGKQALTYLDTHFEQNSQIGVALSAKPEGTLEAVKHLKEENFRLRGQILALQEKEMKSLADACEGQGSVLAFVEDADPVQVRKIADTMMSVCDGTAIVLSGSDALGYRYAIGEKDGNLKEFVKEMNAALSGRGGGKPEFAQGSMMAVKRDIMEFFAGKGFRCL